MKTIPKDKEFAKFCNTLRCPLCNSQLDGNVHPHKANLYCATNNNEYKVEYLPNSTLPTVEIINYYYPQFQYEISMVKQGSTNYHSVVNRLNMDHLPHLRVREKVFEMIGSRLMFFRRRMEEKAFVNKLKLYNVFS